MVDEVKPETMDAKNCTELNLEVVPNSRQFKVMGFNPWTNSLKIKVKEKALKGNANRAVSQELEKLFHAKTEIISGEKSRKKKILVKGISAIEIRQIIESLKTP